MSRVPKVSAASFVKRVGSLRREEAYPKPSRVSVQRHLIQGHLPCRSLHRRRRPRQLDLKYNRVIPPYQFDLAGIPINNFPPFDNPISGMIFSFILWASLMVVWADATGV